MYLECHCAAYAWQWRRWQRSGSVVEGRCDRRDRPEALTVRRPRVVVGDVVDLSDLPSRAFEPDEEASVIDLEGGPPRRVVVVGRRTLLTATAADGKDGRGGSKASVTWCAVRGDVQTLTMDMEATSASLTLSSHRRSGTSGGSAVFLSFRTADDCLDFAQAFCRHKTTGPASARERESTETGRVSGQKPEVRGQSSGKDDAAEVAGFSQREPLRSRSASSSSSSSSPVLDLTEEEQKLLKKYHLMLRRRPSEAVKASMESERVDDRLIGRLLEEEDAAPVTTPDAGAGSHRETAIVLSEEDEKILKKYRLMVKINTPAGAVRHKMELEGVEEHLIEALFRPTEPPSRASASIPKETDQPAGAVVLSDAEEAIASKYRKILKMGVPRDGVRHGMIMENVDSKIVDAVLGTPSTPEEEAATAPRVGPAASTLTDEEEKLAEGYRKMLKTGIPPDGVRHKMTKDGVEKKIVDAVLGKSAEEEAKGGPPNVVAKGPSEEEEGLAEKYRKMLKMGVPPDGVRHKMAKDGVDAKIVHAVLGSDDSLGGASDGNVTEESTDPSEKEETVASEYRKMLKVLIPPDAVRHKQQKDRDDPKIVASGLGSPSNGTARDSISSSSSSAGRSKSTGGRRGTRGTSLVAFHWTPLSGEELEQSVWSKSSKQRNLSEAVEPRKSDIMKLEQLFQKKTNKGRAGGSKGAGRTSGDGGGGANETKMANLVDLTRANNVAISLKAFKDFTHEELARTIADLDPQRKIRGERMQFISDLLPTSAEAKLVQEYAGNARRLGPAERFFRHLQKVKRIESKVQVMQAMDSFHENAREASSKFELLSTVCRQVVQSERLQLVLETVLNVGNIMNEGTRTGGAAGFKFDSLLKLTQTKSADGKMTVLDYIVMTFVAKDERRVLELNEEFPDCRTAGRMQLSDIVGDARALRLAVNRCRTELIKMKNDQSERRVTRSMTAADAESEWGEVSSAAGMSEAAAAADGPFPRNALLAAIQCRGTSDDDNNKMKETKPTAPPSDPRNALLMEIAPDSKLNGSKKALTMPKPIGGDPRNALLSAIQSSSRSLKKKGSDAMKEEKKKGPEVSPGVSRLQDFVEDASRVLSKLEKVRDDTVKACQDMAVYCGETGGEKAAAPLLAVLSEFVTNLQEAVKKYDKQQEAKAKKRAKKDRSSKKQIDRRVVTKGGPTGPKTKVRDPSPSMVKMVNEMLMTASPQTKMEFPERVAHEKPTEEKHKDVRELERTRYEEKKVEGTCELKDAAPTSNGTADFLSARKARGSLGGGAVRESHSRDASNGAKDRQGNQIGKAMAPDDEVQSVIGSLMESHSISKGSFNVDGRGDLLSAIKARS